MATERKNRPPAHQNQKKTEEEHRKQHAPSHPESGGQRDGGHRHGAHQGGHHEEERPLERSETDWPPAERSPSEELSQDDEQD